MSYQICDLSDQIIFNNDLIAFTLFSIIKVKKKGVAKLFSNIIRVSIFYFIGIYYYE